MNWLSSGILTSSKSITDHILVAGMASKTSASSFPNGGSSVGGGMQLQQQSTTKQRRCWSPYLHSHFIEDVGTEISASC
ncbi:hypothetical protein LIER_09194 [Lithospermum erythrorhizon]|uniref:Uncharacterized protein n=1 Tax=Lithospermum erythrorhizon TaxID=34254 RepID=A0AAV3PHN9_LITER